MKKTTILLLFFSFLLQTSCKKKDIFFNLSFSSEATIGSTFGQLIPISLNTPEIQTNSETELEINNTKKEYVKSIYLDRLNLTILTPENQTFSFLNSVEIFIDASGLEEKKIAFKESIPNTVGSQLDLDLVHVDLQEYIKKDKFSIRSVFITDETIAQDVSIAIDHNYLVSAKLSKKK
jgi:hypothetical protein